MDLGDVLTLGAGVAILVGIHRWGNRRSAEKVTFPVDIPVSSILAAIAMALLGWAILLALR